MSAAFPAAACALAYLYLVPAPPGALRSALKTASVALLALAAALSQAPLALVAALSLCTLGDWCLSREGDAAFLAGVGAFAAGHLAYAGLFLSRPEARLAQIAEMPQAVVAGGLAALGLAAAVLLAPRAGDLRAAVLGYIPIILAMGVASLALPWEGARAYALPAALAFIASDLILAWEKFAAADGHPLRHGAPYAVWLLYWSAQAGFLLAFA